MNGFYRTRRLRHVVESPFDVLGVDPEADDVAIERAYRERVLEAHPDHGGSVRQFQQVRAAYAAIQEGRSPEFDVDPADESADGSPADGPDPTARTDPTEAADDASAAAPDEPEETATTEDADGVHVEYLDYDVLGDHGWEIDDDDLFEKAAAADLDHESYGRMRVPDDEPLLRGAEENGMTWPYACRGGACSNCAVALVDGEMPMPAGHILPEEWIDRGIRLSCLTAPTSEEAKVVFNVKHLPGLDELRLTPSRFDRARLDD
jgi:ferredoxin